MSRTRADGVDMAGSGRRFRPLVASDLLHHAVLHAAEAAPDSVAFRFLDDALTYGALASRMGRLAQTLRSLGIERGDRVGLYFNKSLESAIALFGVMQAGAAYVPLDPASPPQRLKAVLRGCGAKAVITHPPRAQTLVPALEDADVQAVIGMDAGAADLPGAVRERVSWAEALNAPEAPGSIEGASDLDLAYVIFTSGSTGAPKGIMHTHQSGSAYARMSAALYDLTPDDRISSLAPLHFDMSTFDYFSATYAGAATTIVSEAHLRMPASLSELAAAERWTIWYSVPFALTQLLSYGDLDNRDLSSIRWVLYGGEPFAPKLLEALTRRLPGARFSNVYGPAEVNQCTVYNFDGPWLEADGPPPIGGPVPNADLLVLDESDGIAAPGEIGELVVRAPTMMRGYWNRPELNARVFLRRPGEGGIDDTWLRTGDLVRMREDGRLSFVGRKDRQVKTRGYRVELDEVEEALSGHEAVQDVAAFPVRLSDDLTIIEAAVTLKPPGGVEAADLAAFARSRLPSYAAPTELRVVGSLPRTTSGKIDRRRLAADAAERRRKAGGEL